MKLNRNQKMSLLRGMPPCKKQKCRLICRNGRMKGEGIRDILKKVQNFLGPIARTVGPVVLKEFLLPYLKKKFNSGGNGLKLAGSGKKKKKTIYY